MGGINLKTGYLGNIPRMPEPKPFLEVRCRKHKFCQNDGKKYGNTKIPCCAICTENQNSTANPKKDFYKPRFGGIKFLP